MLTTTDNNALYHTSQLVPVDSDPNQGQIAVMDYPTYRLRVDEVKASFNAAVHAEQDARARVQSMQADLVQLLTDPTLKDRVDLQNAKRLELEYVEADWQTCALVTAELRSEIVELGKQRDGDYSDEYRFCGIHSLDHCKPIPYRAEDISPQRKRLVRDAYPQVNPAYGFNAANPDAEITEDATREAFMRLDTTQQGYITIHRLVQYLETKGDFGIPNYAEKFIFNTLKSLKSPPVGGDKIILEQFRLLMLRWTSL